MTPDDDAPHVCPGCHAVGAEPCAPGCPDHALELEDEADREFGPVCRECRTRGCDCPVDDEYDLDAEGWV